MSRYQASSGFHIIQLIGLIIIGLMLSALAVDFSYYFAAQNQLQTAADSAALAATNSLYRDIEVDPTTKLENARVEAIDLVDANTPGLTLDSDDVIFGFVDPISRVYNPDTFRTASTNPDYAYTSGYNAVYVRVRKSGDGSNGALNTLLANLFGVSAMKAEAESVALIDQSVNSITNGGLRPVYVCEGQFRKAVEDGVVENNVIRIYGDHVEVDGVTNIPGCPQLGSGNWGFADLRNCSPDAVGSSTIGDWFAKGFPGTVNTGQCYSTNPGNFISSISTELDNLISSQTIFPLPLYDSFGGGGSNTFVNVSGFVGFKITGYKANGAQASRYIEGRFLRHTCKEGCTSGDVGTGGTTPGGSVVKIRLASRS